MELLLIEIFLFHRYSLNSNRIQKRLTKIFTFERELAAQTVDKIEQEDLQSAMHSVPLDEHNEEELRRRQHKQMQEIHQSTISDHRSDVPLHQSLVQKTDYINFRFQCDQCLLSYKQNKDLLLHKRRKHAAQLSVYECHLCEKKFSTKYLLSAHSKDKHEMTLSTEILRECTKTIQNTEEGITVSFQLCCEECVKLKYQKISI